MSGKSTEGARDASTPNQRIALFGGSFDPPHLGHLTVARAARAALNLDTVLFAPVGAQPLKPQGASASFEDRVAMTQLAIAGEPGFQVSFLDAPHPEGAPNYTIDTLHSLRAAYPPQTALFTLMGADSLLALNSWHLAHEIPFAAALIVASRPGQRLTDLQAALPVGLAIEPAKNQSNIAGIEVRHFEIVNSAGLRAPFYLLPGLDVEISASAIRASLQAEQRPAVSDQDVIPKSVAEYIRAHRLYR